MKMTFRWYGENDPIPLKHIKQIPGCSGIMAMVDRFPAGEVWDKEYFSKFVKEVNDAGLEVEVIESINVHEDIKMGLPTRDKYIENYKQSIKNVAECGVKVIVYNFMPVFDWLKTDLNKELADGSTTLYYNHKDLEGLTPQELVKNTINNAGGFSLPGWEPERLKELERVLEIYKDIDEDKLFENYKYFLEGIIPTCEKYGVRMAVHPDDPAWPVFNIPRITHTKEQIDKILSLVDSPSNSLCLCTGSLGSNPNNDLVDIIRDCGKRNRIAAMHIRNIKILGDKEFYESAHLSSEGSFDMVEIVKALYESGFDGYIRPDHGRMIWGEKGRAGYGLYDRALGLNYINGIWETVEKLNK